jgi:hypothetical protein
VAIGLVVLMNTRPLEAMILGVVIAISIFGCAVVKHRVQPSLAAERIVLPIALVMSAAVGAMAYYNWRVTGSAWQVPYILHIKTYGTPQGFFWQKPFYVSEFRYPEIRDEYLRQRALHARRSSLASLARATIGRLRTGWAFYFGFLLSIPLIFLIWAARRRKVQLALLVLVPFALVQVTYHGFFPHFAAPVTGILVLLTVQCWRHLRLWSLGGGKAGLFLARTLPLAMLAAIAILVVGRSVEAMAPPSLARLSWMCKQEFSGPTTRGAMLRQLQHSGGKHLVFVRYQPGHHPDNEWVYNRADIDRADVVWAREWKEESNRRLKEYFTGRRIWIAEPDAHPPRLTEVRTK